MRTTTLGSAGPEVGVIGLGCMGMTLYDMATPRDDATSIAVIHQALDLGMTLIDTADVYGPYTNEELVGRALAGRPPGAGGAGDEGRPGHRLPQTGGPGTTRRSIGNNGRPEHIRAVDRRQPAPARHRPCRPLPAAPGRPEVPIEESWGAMAEAVAAGKARHIGLSEVTVDQIKRAQAVHPVASVQSELSLWTRDALAEVLPYCAGAGHRLPAVLAAGPGFPRRPVLLLRRPAAERLPARACRVSSRTRCEPTWPSSAGSGRSPSRAGPPPAQVALAWVLAQGRLRDSDPRDQDPEVPAGQRRRGGRRAERRGPGRTGRPARARRRPLLTCCASPIRRQPHVAGGAGDFPEAPAHPPATGASQWAARSLLVAGERPRD